MNLCETIKMSIYVSLLIHLTRASAFFLKMINSVQFIAYTHEQQHPIPSIYLADKMISPLSFSCLPCIKKFKIGKCMWWNLLPYFIWIRRILLMLLVMFFQMWIKHLPSSLIFILLTLTIIYSLWKTQEF